MSANAAFLTAYAYDINGNWIGEINSTRIGGTTDWTKVQLILGSHNVPAGTHSIYAGVTRTPSTGTSWFDAIQLEVGSIESAYNLVENASFEKGGSVPAQWIANFTPVTGEGRVTNFKHAGNASFKINGQAGVNKFIRQRINVSGDQNSRYTLSGWSYADNPNPNGGYYGLQVAINHTDGTVDWSFANDFSKVNHADMGWEHVVAEIKPTKSFSSIDVYYLFYNQTGNAWFDIMRLQEGNNITGYQYDAAGNYVTRITDTVKNITRMEYNAIGDRTKVIDPKNNATNFAYDVLSRLTQVTNALNGVTAYGYDNNGNRTSVTDAKNNTTLYEYNEVNQVKRITDPLNKATTFAYDITGNQTTVNYANGNSVGFGYDNLDRLNVIRYNGGTRYTFGYDSNGNRTSMADVGKNETTQYAYDSDDKLTLVTEPNNNKASYSYDKTGNIKDLTTTIGVTVYTANYRYNPLQQLTGLTFGSFWSRFAYNENGNPSGSQNSNGTQSFFNYDDAGRLRNLRISRNTGSNLGNYSYAYDANSNITSIALTSDSLGAKTLNYTYDALNRLTGETLRNGTQINYTYDAVGNRTGKVTTPQGGSGVTISYTYGAAKTAKRHRQQRLHLRRQRQHDQ